MFIAFRSVICTLAAAIVVGFAHTLAAQSISEDSLNQVLLEEWLNDAGYERLRERLRFSVGTNQEEINAGTLFLYATHPDRYETTSSGKKYFNAQHLADARSKHLPALLFCWWKFINDHRKDDTYEKGLFLKNKETNNKMEPFLTWHIWQSRPENPGACVWESKITDILNLTAKEEVLKTLIKEYVINEPDKQGTLPLFLAAEIRSEKLVKALLPFYEPNKIDTLKKKIGWRKEVSLTEYLRLEQQRCRDTGEGDDAEQFKKIELIIREYSTPSPKKQTPSLTKTAYSGYPATIDRIDILQTEKRLRKMQEDDASHSIANLLNVLAYYKEYGIHPQLSGLKIHPLYYAIDLGDTDVFRTVILIFTRNNETSIYGTTKETLIDYIQQKYACEKNTQRKSALIGMRDILSKITK